MNTAASPKPRLGFRRCQECGADTHYKKLELEGCAGCGVSMARALGDLAADAILDEAFGPVLPAVNVVPLPGAPVVFEPYVVMENFRTMIGDVTGVFKKGMVLTDHGQIESLKQTGHPIAPASQASGLACCPNCKHVFPMMASAVGRKSAG